MLTIGDLARAAGVGVSTVRHYERQGLITPSGRSQGNYRLYLDADLQELRFVVQAKRLGFTLAEIRELLFLDERHDACADLNQRIREKRSAITQRIAELQRMDQALGMLLERCPGNPEPGSLKVCPMWASLHDKDAPR
jgi:DNA-binding transcriptional MerR regulator